MTGNPENDRRKLQRFQLKAPAIVKAMVHEQATVAELYTRDICSGGAFFPTENPLPAGVPVEITLFLPVPSASEWRGRPHRLKVFAGGTIVRCERDGMAVAFGERCRMVPVRA